MVVAVGRFFDMVIGTVKGWFGAGARPAPGVSVGGEVSISIEGNFESWLSPTWSGGVRTEPIINYDFKFEPYLRVEGEVPIDKFEFGYEHKINPVTGEISDKQTFGLRGSDLKVFHEKSNSPSEPDSEQLGLEAVQEIDLGILYMEFGVENTDEFSK